MAVVAVEDYMETVWGPWKPAPHKHFLVYDEEGGRWICLLDGRAFSKEEVPPDSTFYAVEI